MSGTFPPDAPTTLTKTIPSYLYEQYNDDDDLQAFVDAQNAYTQAYVDWFNGLNLPIYTGSIISGPLLDWVAQGLYGISRPTLTTGSSNIYGAYNTVPYDTLGYNVLKKVGTAQFTPVTDDIFKRIITWHVYKGDGWQYSTFWLKRRIHRFLNGPNGTSQFNGNTYDVSVTYPSRGNVTISLVNTQIAQIFQKCVQNNVLALPFTLTFSVTLT